MKFILSILTILSVFYFDAKKPTPPLFSDFLIGGIQTNEPDLDTWTNTVKEIGMNTIEVTHYAKQGDWNSDYLYIYEDKAGTIKEIQNAKSKGLKVVMVLRLTLMDYSKKNKFLWHGMVMPSTDTQINTWFDRYQSYVNDWAKICAEEGVDALVIGSEMNAIASTIPIKSMPDLYAYFASEKHQREHEYRLLPFEAQLPSEHLWVRGNDNYTNLPALLDDRIAANQKWATQITFGNNSRSVAQMNVRRVKIKRRWISLIESVRKIYKGPLGYAANFDNYQEVDFWQHLDFIGINAYFALRDGQSNCGNDYCLEMEMRASWKSVWKTINEFKASKGISDMPIMFTELGYIRRQNTSIEPWQGFGFSLVGAKNPKLIIWDEQKPTLQERAIAVNTLHQVVKAQKEPLIGILYWKLTSHEEALGYEPFALHIKQEDIDPLQTALLKFK